jgi:hypothetical protein
MTKVQTTLATQNTTPNDEGFVDIRTVASRLQKTPRSVQNYCRLGMIPFVRLGRSVLFSWPAVQQHIEQHFTVKARNN